MQESKTRSLCLDLNCRECEKIDPPFRIHPPTDPTSLIEIPKGDRYTAATFGAWCDCGAAIMASSSPSDEAVIARRAFLSRHKEHALSNGGPIVKVKVSATARKRRAAKA
jgi:hypothetical protein